MQPADSLQDHTAFRLGQHDFQADIEMLAGSALVGTILETVMLATDMRFAAVARVTADRWVACRTVDEISFGLLEGDEIAIQSTFCQTVRDTSRKVIFSDVHSDPAYRDHPVASKFGIVSYVSVPIFRSDRSFFGTLCAIDTEPRDIKNPRAIAMLDMFADLIGRSLEAEERLEAREQEVVQERELARIQEEFVAILGHDLRNPVASLDAGIRQLGREPLSDMSREILSLMRSTVRRMNDLVDNMMLHATARLGGGIRISATQDAPLAAAITQVVEEVLAACPERRITLDLAFDCAVACDAPRVAQAVSNLLSNAISHGTPGAPIAVHGSVAETEIVISVANSGPPIPDSLREKLFQPFQRGTAAAGEGLGLGLYIASSITIAHSGRIEVASEDGTTTFILRLPILPAKG